MFNLGNARASHFMPFSRQSARKGIKSYSSDHFYDPYIILRLGSTRTIHGLAVLHIPRGQKKAAHILCKLVSRTDGDSCFHSIYRQHQMV